MRRTKECAEQTRQSIISAAFDVFLKDGYESSSLEKICRAANVTRGAAYWHFKNKRDLYHQTVVTVLGRLEEVREGVVADENMTGPEKISEILWLPNEFEREFNFIGKAVEFVKRNPSFQEITTEVEQSEMRLYWVIMTELSKCDGAKAPVEELATIVYSQFLGMHGYPIASKLQKNMTKDMVRIFVNMLVDSI